MLSLYDLLKKSDADLTFEDVLLAPQYSEILPRDANIQTRIAGDIELKIPVISAAMDKITEAPMATALALEGGLGIIHALFTIEEQAAEVRKVKRFQAGFLLNPYTVSPDTSIRDLVALTKQYNIGTFPVTEDGNSHGKLVGMITKRDYSKEKHIDLKVKDRMTPFEGLLTATGEITLEEANEILIEKRRGKLLIMDKDKNLHSMVTRTDIDKNSEYPSASKDNCKRLRVGAAVSPVDPNLDKRIQALIEEGVDIIDVESAHGHSKAVGDAVAHIKREYGISIMAGNICTENGLEYLRAKGADAVKIGVGPGSTCKTRIVGGVGRPQLTAIAKCAEYLDNSKYTDVYLIADGGFVPDYLSHIGKSIAAGAHAIMSGRLFAGTTETPGDIVDYGGSKWKVYRGMGSKNARIKAKNIFVDRYMPNLTGKTSVEEGKEGVVPFVGPVKNAIEDVKGSLTLTMGYLGIVNMAELRKLRYLDCWSRSTEAGKKESSPHDLYDLPADIRR